MKTKTILSLFCFFLLAVAAYAVPATEVRSLVLLVQFQDVQFQYSPEDFDKVFSTDNKSVKRYFEDQFGTGCSFVFDISPVITLSRDASYYGSDSDNQTDVNAPDGVIEACRAADKDIDFSLYDNDGDGVVENLIVIVAGPRQTDGAGDNSFWPKSWSIRYGSKRHIFLDGCRIDNYGLATELCHYSSLDLTALTSIGVICHEFGHLLGLKDMYDSDGDYEGRSNGLWRTSLMDYGCNNDEGRTPPNLNAIEREMLGIGTPVKMQSGSIELQPVNQSGMYVRMNADVEGEYFLFENRKAEGWDEFIGTGGMLVYHIDKSSNDAGGITAAERWEQNRVNTNPYFECAHLIANSSVGEAPDIFFGDGSSLIWRSHRDFEFRDGNEPLFGITKVVRKGDDLILDVSSPISVDVLDIYQDAVILNWSTDVDSYMDSPSILQWEDSDGFHDLVVMPYVPGKYSYTIENLDPKTDYVISVSYRSGSENIKSIELKFTTKPLYPGTYPVIYLKDAARTVDQCFQKGTRIPLRLTNLTNSEKVEWFFNKSQVDVDKTGYFVLDKSGTLESRITYSNGETEIIIKEIVVK